mgnify:CR=1 FL=1
MQILKMDFQSQSAPPVVPVMQSDAQSRFIGIALYNGGTPYACLLYTSPSPRDS